METINQRVARCRKLANLTQTDVAEKLNMKCSTYSQMERKGIISAERLLKLAQIFDVSPNYLLNGQEIPGYELPPVTDSQNHENGERLLQSTSLPKSETFIITKKEENFIKMVRYLSKSAREDIMDYVHTLYTREKYGKTTNEKPGNEKDNS